MNRLFVIATLCCLALAACDKNEAKPQGESAATTPRAAESAAPTAAAPTQPATAQFTDTDLATAADFEDEADKAISAKTYKAELADLEKEIAKD